jgi:hypothetical protein
MASVNFDKIRSVEVFLLPVCIDWFYEGKYIFEDKMYFGGCLRIYRYIVDEPSIYVLLDELSHFKKANEINALVDRSLWAVLHELSHFIEIDDIRALNKENWGLRGSGKVFRSHSTDFAVQRELRVLAIQFQLSQCLGIPFDIKESVSLLKETLYPSFLFLPGDSMDERIIWAIAKVNELIQQPEYKPSQLIAEFGRKKELFRNFTLTALKQS